MARKKGWLERNWPFDHNEVRLNTDTNLIKIVAMVTMLIDHLGAVVFPEYRVMRIIGRVAFPIYAYCIAVGCVYTRDIGKYLQRLVILALLVQPLYAVALNHTNSMMTMYSFSENPFKAIFYYYIYSWRNPSIMLSLIMGVAAIWSLKTRKIWTLLLILLMTYVYNGYFDYGVKGVILMVLLYAFCNAWYISLPLVGAFMVYWGVQSNYGMYSLFGIYFNIQIFALMALPLIYIPMHTKMKLNKWIFYAFYPAHLLIIELIKNWDAIMNAIFG